MGVGNITFSMGDSNQNQVLFDHQEFLGDRGQFVSAKCVIGKYFDDDKFTKLTWANPWASLRLSNGSDIIDMDLELYESETRQEAVEKLAKLIAVLETLKSAITYADDQMVELDAIIKSSNKTNEEIITPVS